MSGGDWVDLIEGFERAPAPEEPASITVREILEDYQRDFLFRGCRSEKSLRCEVKQLNKHFGALRAEEVTRSLMLEYQRNRREKRAAATVNKEFAVLRAAFRVALENEKIASLPAFPRALRPARPRQGFFEEEDYVAIRAELPDWGQDILDFSYYSGWRRGEVLGLQWGEVDLGQRLVRLDPARAKNNEARMPLPLLDFGLAAIERRHRARLEGCDYVFFCYPDGRQVRPTTFTWAWRTATRAARREHLLFHDLRRTVARRLERNGVPRMQAMGWIGHKTESIYRRYSIVNEGDMWAAADKFLGRKEVEKKKRGRAVRNKRRSTRSAEGK